MKSIISISVLFSFLAGSVSSSSESAYTAYSSSNVNGGSSSSSSYGTGYKNNYYGYSGAYGTNLFADSANNYYDGYQQAWRYLGWYVKCGYPSDRYNDNGSGDHGGSQDNNNRYEGNNYCQRYLIWAAYVDENYQGGGIGEYSYYDPFSGSWDNSACNTHGNGRCAPMDCHETNSSTWTLMGVFKEASYFGDDAFFEQLFKHEGYCLWDDDDTYEFMSEAREEKWPQGCVSTGYQGNGYYFDDDYSYGNGNGNYIYIDLKPTWNGNMTYGLYTDSACKNEYEGLDLDPDKISASMGLLYGSYLRAWNDALEVYKVCQPCKAYNLNQQSSTWTYNKTVGKYTYTATDDDSRSNEDDDYLANDPNEGYFQCDDDAGYTNVNQCMKFRSHAELEVATWEDLVTATNQGGILQVNVGGTIFGSERMSSEQYKYMTRMRRSELASEAQKYQELKAEVNMMEPEAEMWSTRGRLFLGVGGALFLIAIFRCIRARCCRRNSDEDYSEPLLNAPPQYMHEASERLDGR